MFSLLRPAVISSFGFAFALPSIALSRSDRTSTPRSGGADASCARVITVTNGFGRLIVSGTPGATTVSATAYARSSSDLQGVQLRVERSGDAVIVEPRCPRTFPGMWCNCSMEMTAQVPPSLPVQVRDGSGGAEIHDVGDLTVISGSGGVDANSVGGELPVGHTGSGGVHHTAVRGRVSVPMRGRSGEI